jgi:predicted nuclease with TOPRIM domain
MVFSMPITQADLNRTKDEIIEAVGAMFVTQSEQFNERMDGLEGRMDGLEGRMANIEGRMDGLEGRMSALEREFRDFKSYVGARFDTLESRLDSVESNHVNRFDNVEEDIRLLYRLVDKLEHGNKKEKAFAKETIVKHLPAIYRAVLLVAKDLDVKLPEPADITK